MQYERDDPAEIYLFGDSDKKVQKQHPEEIPRRLYGKTSDCHRDEDQKKRQKAAEAFE